MKLNWGHGITIFFTIFVGIMLTILYLSKQKNIDLVTEDYYAEELQYQDKIDHLKNSTDLGLEIIHELNDSELVLLFPQEKITSAIDGKVHIYRPSDAKLDFEEVITLDQSAQMHIDRSKFGPGYYILKFNFDYQGKPYYYEKAIMI